MTTVLYYSNSCKISKDIIQQLSRFPTIKNNIDFICTDRLEKSSSNITMIVLNNGSRLPLPPQVNRVPALVIFYSGNKIQGPIFGTNILNFFKEKMQLSTHNAMGVPSSFNDTIFFIILIL